MKRLTASLRFSLAAVLLALALPLAAASDDALALVPADAAAVGVIHVADLRSSPLFDHVFAEMDRISGDADAARFLEEARLKPRQDVDLIVMAGSPKGTGGSDGRGLVLFEGRFDPAALASAIAGRGAIRRSTPDGDYFLLPEKGADASNHEPGAISFASARLVVAGTETSVVQALAQRSRGGTPFRSGAGLGRHLGLVDSDASAWALVDVSRIPQTDAAVRHAHAHGSGADAAGTLVTTLKSVSLLVFQATAKGDALSLNAKGLVADDETAGLMEDTLRGVLAAWRLAAQEKSPEMVSVLRKFRVTREGTTVSIGGTLPGAVVQSLAEKKHATAR